MVKKEIKKIISMLLVLTMICSSVSISEKTVSAGTEETVVYSGCFAYDTDAGHLYEFVETEETWDDAVDKAKDKGGYLVCNSSSAENALVLKLMQDQEDAGNIWIGYYRSESDTTAWQWLDGGSSSYTNWASGEPNNVTEKAAEMYFAGSNAGRWNDADAEEENYYVIEYDSCNHPESVKSVYKNSTITDCNEGGYEGDICCGLCGNKTGEGKTVAAGTEHGTPVLDKNSVVEKTCTTDGYTGDYVCPTCHKVLTKGHTIEHTGHVESEDVRDAVKANCYMAGYTGDTYCTVCDETMTVGTVIAKKTHEYESDVCKNCGRINNAQLGVTYSMETTALQLFQVIRFTAPGTGEYEFLCTNGIYWDSLGYLYKSSKYKDTIITSAMSENNSKKLNGYLYRDDDGGGKGAPKIVAELTKGETYYFVVGPYSSEFGKFTVKISCKHKKSHVENREITDCSSGGYTGDIVCDACGEVLEEGKTITAGTEHGTPVLDEDSVVEKTCTTDGYTGDYVCPDCHKVLTEGHTIEHTGHVESEDVRDAVEANCYMAGYTGDTYCTICEETITEGTVIAQKTHEYENDVCKNCGGVADAKEGITYNLKTTESQKYQVIEFKPSCSSIYKFYCSNTTSWDSYGYLCDGDYFSDDIIVDALTSTSSYYRILNCMTSDDDSGANNAPAIEMFLTKGKTYYFVVGPYSSKFGEFTITINCTHHKTHIEGRTVSDCSEGGYSGDEVCDYCGEVINKGVQVSVGGVHNYIETEHTDATCNSYASSVYECEYCGDTYTKEYVDDGYGSHSYVMEGYVPATCTEDGCTGHGKCIYCGQKSDDETDDQIIHNNHYTEESEKNPYFIYNYMAVAATCEQAGYTGDTICHICNEVIEQGTEIAAMGHDFEKGTCINCGIDKIVADNEVDGYYQIKSFDDLICYLRSVDESPKAGIKGKLMADISFPDDFDDEYGLIGQVSLKNTVFDGGGHTISNINVDGIPAPLFYSVYNSEVINLSIKSNGQKYIDNSDEDRYFIDLAMEAYGSTFTNCTVEGTKNIECTNADYVYFAMIDEAEKCEFNQCINNAQINISGYEVDGAGIVCIAYDTQFIECVNNGNITIEADDYSEISGIVGCTYNSSLIKCINNGNISAKGWGYVSGIVSCAGYNSTNNTMEIISGCVNNGVLDGRCVYGICYYSYNLRIDGCKNNADFNSTQISEEAIGILGYAYLNTIISNCRNEGNIKAKEYGAGICGNLYASYNFGSEGLIYYNVSISDCVNTGNVESNKWSAGILWYAYCAYIDNCYNSGNITGNLYSAGIINSGYNNKISHCVNDGNISGINCVGGISSYEEDSLVSNVYNTGKVDSEGQALNANNLVYGLEGTTVTDSEENHKHDYSLNEKCKPATVDKDGLITAECKCGCVKEIVINKIGDVNISATKYVYNGNNITLPIVSVKDSKGNVIDSRYYTVTYKNKTTGKVVTQISNIGTYEAVVTFKTLYSGIAIKTFTVENKTDTTTTVSKVKKPGKVKKVTAKKKVKKKRISLKWKKLKKVKGYQIRYATNKKMKKAKIKMTTKTKYVIKKVKKKTYYIQVRAYRLNAKGKKVVGKWSKKKVVKMK